MGCAQSSLCLPIAIPVSICPICCIFSLAMYKTLRQSGDINENDFCECIIGYMGCICEYEESSPTVPTIQTIQPVSSFGILPITTQPPPYKESPDNIIYVHESPLPLPLYEEYEPISETHSPLRTFSYSTC